MSALRKELGALFEEFAILFTQRYDEIGSVVVEIFQFFP